MTPARRLTCASERSRWNGVGSTRSIGKRGEDLPVAAERVAEDREDRSAVLFDLACAASRLGAGGDPEATSARREPSRGGSLRSSFSAAASHAFRAELYCHGRWTLRTRVRQRLADPTPGRSRSARCGSGPYLAADAPAPLRARSTTPSGDGVRRLGQAREPQPDEFLQGRATRCR